MFQNRADAGRQLASKLQQFKNTRAIILAVPRGGVPVAYVIAKELSCAMQIILTKKIGHPHNKEYAIGAASLTNYFIIPHEDVSEEYIAGELDTIRARLREMQRIFVGNKIMESLEGRTLIIVDDGIATGNTLLVTLQLLQESNPSKMIIAAPVASVGAVHKLERYTAEVITISIPAPFYGVGAYYKNFSQVTDEEVLYYLDQNNFLG